MNLIVVFQIPDDDVSAYADIAERLIEAYRSRKLDSTVKHWSFDLEMRPIAAMVVPQ